MPKTFPPMADAAGDDGGLAGPSTFELDSKVSYKLCLGVLKTGKGTKRRRMQLFFK